MERWPEPAAEARPSRRTMLSGAAALAAVPALASWVPGAVRDPGQPAAGHHPVPMENHGHAGFAGGSVPPERAGIDPTAILHDFDRGRTRTLADDRTLREWDIVAVDEDFEIAPTVTLTGWRD